MTSSLLAKSADQYDPQSDQQNRRVVESRLGDTDQKTQRLQGKRGHINFGETTIQLVNGANNNIAVGYTTYVRITGPTSAFSITGIADGEKGQSLILHNTTAHAMTIANESASSIAANRILTLSGADMAYSAPGGSMVVLVYDVQALRFKIVSNSIPDGSVGTDELADGSVTSIKIANGTIAEADIADNAVTDAKLRDSVGLSVVGRAANTTGDPADIVAANDGEVLRRSGTAVGFGQVVAAGIASDAVITAKIINDAVTYAKMQNISATSRILGRKSASAGDTEECTLSEVLDFIGSVAQGDILYRDASAWARLGAGTSGQFLKTNGAAANPSWDTAGGWTLLNSGTVSAAATLDLVLTSYTAYRALAIYLNNFIPATDDVNFWARTSTDGGATYTSSAGAYMWVYRGFVTASSDTSSSSDTEIELMAATVGTVKVGNGAAEGLSCVVTLTDQVNTAVKTRVQAVGNYYAALDRPAQFHSMGYRVTAQDTDAIRFLFSSGNIASGKWAIYGIT